MAPTPDWEPEWLRPVQNTWTEHVKPVHGNYMSVIGALGSIFGFAGAVSLLVIRKFQLPEWPFTEENWNPKPTVEKTPEEKEKEVTEEEIEEDELAIAAGGLGKRSVAMERDWATEAGFYQYLRKREEDIIENVEEVADKVKNKTSELAEKAKSTLEDVEGKAKDAVKTVEGKAKDVAKTVEDKAKSTLDDAGEEAKTLWDDIKEEAGEIGQAVKEAAAEVIHGIEGVFGGGDKKDKDKEGDKGKDEDKDKDKGKDKPKSGQTLAVDDADIARVKRHRRAVRFVD